jgi:hypothetical protein
MTQKEKALYYLSLPLFLVSCIVSNASIADNLSTRGSHDGLNIERSIFAMIITIGLAFYAYFGLVKYTQPKKLPKTIYWLSRFSFAISVILVILFILVIVWWHFDPPQWGY